MPEFLTQDSFVNRWVRATARKPLNERDAEPQCDVASHSGREERFSGLLPMREQSRSLQDGHRTKSRKAVVGIHEGEPDQISSKDRPSLGERVIMRRHQHNIKAIQRGTIEPGTRLPGGCEIQAPVHDDSDLGGSALHLSMDVCLPEFSDRQRDLWECSFESSQTRRQIFREDARCRRNY
ncbi:MAG: hypothetical protein U0792_12680 [Gemmataceae bacterium]